eukprot:TRINITY_DN3909_c0_g1_i5.p2 TRINITY_DN3909_c0_g1~~TRINITY_DN3909_c0_g1_i5.p2  ORF type:complete len:176 (-),score=34.80 TRINITY_DN3909_c0_g1_i5:665-1192(-)
MIYQLFFCLIGAYEVIFLMCLLVFFFQAEDGIRDLVRSRGLGDVYKRQSVRLRWCVRVAGRQLVAEEGPTPLLLADMTGQFDLVASPENGGLCLPEPTQGVVLATALAVHTGPERVQERCGEDHHPDQGNMLVRLRMVVLATAAPGRADSARYGLAQGQCADVEVLRRAKHCLGD